MTDSDYPKSKFIRLKAGDDLISEVVEIEEDGEEYYLLIRPQKIVYMPTTMSGYVQLAFIPWVFPRVCEHQEFTIEKSDVLLISDASERMNNYYWKTFEEESDNDVSIKNEEYIKEDTDSEESERLQKILEQLGRDNKRTFH